MHFNRIIGKKKAYLLVLIFTSLCLSFCNSEEKKKEERIKTGKKLFTNVGCATCHSLNTSKLYGPSLHNILATETTVIRNGKEHTFVIDKDYIKKSIKDPDYEKSILYKSKKMPKPSLTDADIDCITDYLININKK